MADEKDKDKEKESKSEKQRLALIGLFIAANELYVKMLVDEMTVENVDQAKIVSMTSMIRKIDNLTTTLKNSSKTAVKGAIENSYMEGNVLAGGSGKYSDSQQSMIDRLVSDTYNDLLIATKYMSESSKKFVRMKVSESMQLQSAITQGNQGLVNSLLRNFTESRLSKDAYRQGFTGIVDKAGRRWNLETYSTMVVNTKMQQAHIWGTADYAHEQGVHLFIISNHSAIDDCAKWEDKIISVGEDIEGYPRYEDIAASYECFHPNCKHHITPVSDRIVSNIRSKK